MDVSDHMSVQADTATGASLPSSEVSSSPTLPPGPTNLAAQAGQRSDALSVLMLLGLTAIAGRARSSRGRPDQCDGGKVNS